MPKFVSKDGKHTTETNSPVERVSLLRQGYREQKPRTRPAATPPAPAPKPAAK